MARMLSLVATLVLLAARPAAAPPPMKQAGPPPAPAPAAVAPAPAPAPAAPAPAEPAPSPAKPAWTSMSHAGVTSALPAQGPMATDLGEAAPAARAAVPLPPPPTVGGKPLAPAAKAGAAVGGAALAAAPAAASAPGPAPAALPGATGAPQPPGFQPRVFAAPGAPAPAAADGPGGPAAAGGQGTVGEPQVKFAADQTGAMVSITQDLESDRLRQNWASQGGQLPAYEANAGMMIMYKALPEMGDGANMTGFGLNGGIRVAILNLTPPKYETRERSWTAFKIGGGADVGVMGVTITLPYTCVMGQCFGGPQSASMTSFTLVGTLGVMKAFGSFDSPSDWSGFALGAEWAPSYQSTTLTMSDGSAPPQTTSSFNATGFALSFESGSMQAMASKLGKKARMKVRLFLLPAVGDLPFLMTASIGAVWY
jgi:hypothetical protein